MTEFTFREWLIGKCCDRGFGYADAADQVDAFLRGNFNTYTARVRAVLAEVSGGLARK